MSPAGPTIWLHSGNLFTVTAMYRFSLPWLVVLVAAWLSGCSTAPVSQAPTTAHRSTYCDSYLMYDMCVQDVDANGVADLMYFEDTLEVFMVSADFRNTLPNSLSLHRCVQAMDSPLQKTSSQLLAMNADSGVLQKTRLKSQLMLEYMRYYTAINSCMNDQIAGHSGTDTSFGDEDFFGDDAFDER